MLRIGKIDQRQLSRLTRHGRLLRGDRQRSRTRQPRSGEGLRQSRMVLSRQSDGSHEYWRDLSFIHFDIVSSCVIVNGWISQKIHSTRGVRQGCPLSPILYVLVAETLSSTIRSTAITGLQLPQTHRVLKVAQYADGTTVVTTSDRDFRILQESLSLYQDGSGARLNISKSCGLFVGPWRDRTDRPMSLLWTTDSLKLLGIHVGAARSLNEMNWQGAIDKMRAVLHFWKPRDLSLAGCSYVARMLAASKLWYVAQVVPAPPRMIDEINTTMWKFIWKDHAELVSRRVCCRTRRNGGLARIIIHDKVAAIQLQWISRLTSTGDDSWKYFARFWLARAASPFTDHRGLLSGNRSPVSSAIPPFYLSLVKTYRRFNGADRTSSSTLSEATSQSLFGNPNITDPSSRLFYSRSMATAGLCTVGDLQENNRWKEIAQLQQRYQVGPYLKALCVSCTLPYQPSGLHCPTPKPLRHCCRFPFHLRRRFLFPLRECTFRWQNAEMSHH